MSLSLLKSAAKRFQPSGKKENGTNKDYIEDVEARKESLVVESETKRRGFLDSFFSYNGDVSFRTAQKIRDDSRETEH